MAASRLLTYPWCISSTTGAHEGHNVKADGPSAGAANSSEASVYYKAFAPHHCHHVCTHGCWTLGEEHRENPLNQVISEPICYTVFHHIQLLQPNKAKQQVKTMLLSPQAEKNWEGLCSMLEDVLEAQSHRQLFALELGSGTGQHVIRFAQKMPFVTWQPSDIKEESLDSIKAYIAATHAKTVLQPVHLDAGTSWEQWAGLSHNSCDVIVAINLLQYSSFKTAQGVFNGAGQILRQDGLLITYGVYAINGTITPSCNENLDAELRKMNPEWGLPDIDVLRQLAYGNGMRLERMIEMEEYFKCLIFRKL